MKALSLYQPWASLIAAGAKHYETRSWATRYRGPLLICASARPLGNDEKTFLKRSAFQRGLISLGGNSGFVVASDLPLGCAVCLVDLIDCLRTDDIEVSDTEDMFGDFSFGRFAWKLENIRPLRQPVPLKGRMGLFDVSGELWKQCEAQLK